jgi:D-glycero-alpha-D-manno-heptose-7-phosphate kinase
MRGCATTSHDTSRPLRIINAAAPIRICDNGGWTDTWFAGHGRIFNIGVYPYAEAQIEVFARDDWPGGNRIVIHAENYGEQYVRDPHRTGWDRHPLLEAAIERMRIPEDLGFRLTIHSEAPAGASTGTSAAVTVALIGALDRLTPGRMSPHEVAYTAQSIETDMLKQQCGIQDQLCSAYGGISYIEMFRYPHASLSHIEVPNSTWWELERRLVLIYLGRSHSSSEVHQRVIRHLEDEGPDCRQLEDLRVTAERSRDAVYAADFGELGRAMSDNTASQGRLHPDLVSADARRVIEIAGSHDALGCKVNGAGGEGGSITILCGPHAPAKRAMIREIESDNRLFRNIPVYLSRHGLRTWEWSISTGNR